MGAACAVEATRMTISFDLDDTLIPGAVRFETCAPGFLQRVFNTEPLRSGIVELVTQLRADGHRIFVYTTSMRSPARIRRLFRIHGIRLDGVINQQQHDERLGERRRDHSKLPPAFGIDVHVDDSPGVGIEGRRYGFRTIILSPDCADWTGFILREVAAIDSNLPAL